LSPDKSFKIHIGSDEKKGKFILLEIMDRLIDGDTDYCRKVDGKTLHISMKSYLSDNGITPKKTVLVGSKIESLFGKKFIVIPIPADICKV
jgi:hypothetical protein